MTVELTTHHIGLTPVLSYPSKSIGFLAQATPFDRIFSGMASQGLGVSAISEFLGLSSGDVEDRAAALGLQRPHDRPLRKARAGGWSTDHIRQLITLWVENVTTKSIAAAIGRSASSIHSKRRRLGLGLRARTALRERSIDNCKATSWRLAPTKIAENAAIVVRRIANPEKRWDSDRSKRCSYMAFAGLSNIAIAARMTAEIGVEFSVKAIADQLCRLQVFRDRNAPKIDVIDEADLATRAKAFIEQWGMQWRKCEGTGHFFWYSRVRGGPRNVCREFQRKKYAAQRQGRGCLAYYSGV